MYVTLTGHGAANNIENGIKNAKSKRIGKKLIFTNCLIIVNSMFTCPAVSGTPFRLIRTVTQDRHVQIAPRFH